LIQPAGASLGLGSSLGQNLTGGSPGAGGPQASNNLVQPDRKTPYYARWQVGFQRDFGRGWVVEGMYVGSRGRNLPVFRQANNIPIEYLSRSRTRDTAQESLLTQNVPNPFAGLVPGSTINGATVQRQQLLRPFPEFGTFGIEGNTGSDRYHAGSIRAEKRFRSGNSFTVQYTRSSLRDKLTYLNPAEPVLEDRVSPNDRPNRVSVGTSLRLPFGQGKKWGSQWQGVTQALLGGWQLSGTYQYQTGFPIVFGNLYYDASRDPRDLMSNIGKKVNGKIAGLDVSAWDLTGFYLHDPPVQTNGQDDPAKQRADQRIQLSGNSSYRYFPSTLADVRNHDLHLMDLGLYKNFKLPRRSTLQIRIEAINALNYTVLFSPGADPRNATFGFTTADRNNPRDIQLAARFTF
jgi:hypothetical protein